MKTEETEEARQLQWLTEFCNLDLAQIGRGDRAKLLVESDCLWPSEEMKVFGRLKSLGKEDLDALSWVLAKPASRSSEYWSAIVAAQKALRDHFRLLQPTVHRSKEAIGERTASSVIRGRDEMLWRVEKGHGVKYKLTILPVTNSQADYLLLKVLRLLEGFNQQAIRLCPACGRWFFNLTNREKRFCNDRCIWKFNTAKRRKAENDRRKEGQSQ